MPGWNIELPDTPYVCHESDPFRRKDKDIVVGSGAFEVLLREAKDVKRKAIDTETTGLVVWKDVPLYWSMAWEGKRYTLNANTLPYFHELFEDEAAEWVMANAKYDAHILANVGIHLKGKLVDICVGHALLYEDLPHGLKYVAQHLLDWTWADFQDSFGKIGKKQSAEDLIRRAERENFGLLREYAANDAYGTFLVGEELERQLRAAKTDSLFRTKPPYIETLWDFFWKIEVPFTKVLWKMERKGIRVDRSHLDRAKPEAEKSIEQLESKIYQVAGYALNVRSTEQMKQYLYEEKGYAPIRFSKGGRTGVKSPSTDEATLRYYARSQNDKVCELALKHREYSKLLSTYINGLHKLLDPNDRIHTRYNQDVARCMPAGELVLTDRGYIPVEKVLPGDSVLTHLGRAKAVAEITHNPTPCTIYTVTTAHGHKLRTNGAHPYLVETGAGRQWRSARDLKVGDVVVAHTGAERWARVPKWEDFEVSTWGRVRNVKTGDVLTVQKENKWGHLKVTLRREGAQKIGKNLKDFAVHRLVLLAFEGASQKDVRHLNGDIWAGRGGSQPQPEEVDPFFLTTVTCVEEQGQESTIGLTILDDHSHVTGGLVTHNTGRLSSSNPNCFTGETEVLTPRGWVPLKCLEEDATVAQWEDGVIEFVPVTGFVKAPGESVTTIETKHITLEVTQDHRCLLVNRKTGELRVVAAADYKSDYRQLNAGEYSGPGLELQDEEIQFLVAVQAGGSWVHRASGARRLDVGFKKPRKYKRFETLLRAIGATYTRTEGSNKRVRFRVKGAAAVTAWEYLGPDKKLGPWVLELSREQLDVFTEEVWFWDGCWTRKNHYASKDRDNASWVQAALALSNNRARLRRYVNSTGSVSWQVDRTARNYSITTNHKKGTKVTTDGYVYCVSVPSSFLLVRTGQNICVTGNCQNIPRPENDKWNLRGAFVASPGMTIMALDYSSLEMRLLAAASMEKSMIDVFAKGWDIHMGNAHMMYEVPYEELKNAKLIDKKVKQKELGPEAMTPEILNLLQMRTDAKTIGFGLNYGMGASRLANTLGCSIQEAKAKIAAYMKAYPAIDAFFDKCVRETEETGYAFTVLGRRRNIPEIASPNRLERKRGERLAVNTVIQGSAADVCRQAQINIDMLNLENDYGCRMLLQVHDELVFECPTENVTIAMENIRDAMEHPFFEDLAVHLAVEGESGPSWGSAK